MEALGEMLIFMQVIDSERTEIIFEICIIERKQSSLYEAKLSVIPGLFGA
jgi:hypothetical protein